MKLNAFSTKSLSVSSTKFPREVLEEGEAYLKELLQELPQNRPIDQEIQGLLARVLPLSPFLRNTLRRYPQILEALLWQGLALSRLAHDVGGDLVDQLVSGSRDQTDFASSLRYFRALQMTRIALRDMGGLSTFEETAQDLTLLARICLEATISWLEKDMLKPFGRPVSPQDIPIRLICLGMGKLGAWELNFSSDIDLIFSFASHGKTKGGNQSIENEEYFLRQARRLIQILSQNTAQGLVFRVDTRLRPFGDAGPLVMSMEAMEEYYENHGRQWERYALIKASPVAGDISAGNQLLKALEPFIYRRYLDYSTIDSLKEMKAMIQAEQAKKGITDNVKLGPGGIRDLEFIVQTFQLIKGGRIKSLQTQSFLRAIKVIRDLALLDPDTCDLMVKGYLFLRTTENRLQEYSDQQTHILPRDKDKRTRLALSLGFGDWEGFYTQYKEITSQTSRVFQELFYEHTAPANNLEDQKQELKARSVWGDPLGQEGEELLGSLGFRHPADTCKLIGAFKFSKALQSLEGAAKELVDRLIPKVILACSSSDNPDKALKSILAIFEAILRRTIYLMLLDQYPNTLEHLVYLCSKSAMIAQLLQRQPILLDELLDANSLFSCQSQAELNRRLEAIAGSLGNEDLELWMDELRRFKKANLLRIAACQLKGLIKTSDVGPQLSTLAEVIISWVFKRTWSDLKDKAPPELDNLGPRDGGLCIVAYGKLGSREMSYASDLDLIFLYDHAAFEGLSGGKRAQISFFYSRIIQRMIFMLSTRTSQGLLYPIDTRLRPNGSQGVLVTSIDSFREYQLKKAWTWEHQALIKARFLWGDEGAGRAFEDIRKMILAQKRDPAPLKKEVREMRDKIMAVHHKGSQEFDLKRGPGGLIDIEFLVQYLVLLYGGQMPEILANRSVLDFLDAFSKVGLLDKDTAFTLSRAYLDYTKRIQLLALDLKEPLVPAWEFQAHRDNVQDIFNQFLG